MKIKFKYLPAMSLLLAAQASAGTSSAPVTQDGWLDALGAGATTVQDGGVGGQLNLATPNPSGASQYTRKAWFGFDLSAIKAAVAGQSICSASITFQLTTNVGTSYNGNNAIRFYGVTNANPGSVDGTAINSSFFDETLTTWANAPGNIAGDVLAGDKVNGTVLGDVAVPNPAASGVMVLSGLQLVNAIKSGISGTNNWITVAASYLGQNNDGFNPTPPLGLSFISKEVGTGKAILSVDYQATACSMVVITQPQSGYYYPGATVDLAVQVSGAPVITYQWQHAGTNLPGATSSVLTLNTVQAAQAGNYQAFMTNPSGATNSSVASVSLLSAPAISGGFEQFAGTNQPLGYWRLNETAPIVQDFATNSGSLGAVGSGSYLGGVSHPRTGALVGSSDTAGYFDGLSSRIIVPFDPSLNPGVFTAEIWANPASIGANKCVLSCGDFASPRAGWLIYMQTTGWNLRFYNQNGNTVSLDITGGGAPVVGNWYHLVVTFDGTTATLYVNGVATTGTPVGTPVYVPGTAGAFCVGARADNSFWWNGTADEAAFYPTALSAVKVAAHYANGTNASPAPTYNTLVTGDGAVEYLRLNEPNVTVTAINRGIRGPAADGTYAFLAAPAAPGIATGASGPQPPQALGFEAGNKAATFTGAYISVPGVNLNKNTATIAAWVKRNGSQQSWAGLLFTRAGGTTAGLHFGAGPDDLRYTWAGGQYDWSSGLVPPDGVWTFAALVVEPTKATMYMYDGTALKSAVHTATHAVQSFSGVTYLGLDPNNFTTRTINGDLDEVAIFDRALTPEQIAGLVSSSRYGTTAPSITRGPLSQSILAGESATFDVVAAGSLPLSYQWTSNSVPIPGATAASYTIANAYYTAAATYGVTVNNAVGPATSSSATLTVVPPNPTYANLTNGLVLHLKFDGDYFDTSGRTNHASAPVGPPAFVAGKIGSGVHLNASGTNYLTVSDLNGDLLFDAPDSFTVAMWLKYSVAFNDVPIIGNALNSTYQPGWVMTEDGGRFEWTAVGGGSIIADPVGGPLINNGTWHHVAVAFDRTAGSAASYVDGVRVDLRALTGLGSLITASALTIGQDPSGAYGSANFDLDDVGIWRRALKQSEAESIYLVGQNYGKTFDSFGPVVLTAQKAGNQLELTWPVGTLQSADEVTGPWTPVAGASAPYYKTTPSATRKFYMVRPLP